MFGHVAKRRFANFIFLNKGQGGEKYSKPLLYAFVNLLEGIRTLRKPGTGNRWVI